LSTKGRLTRQELGWLLTQEAQGAAERLRVGVQVLKTNAPPAPEVHIGESHGLDATLDALDDAMKMLSSLHQTPGTPRGGGRRGRIDLAALIWEVAPDARVSIEPGGGTEVFGEEGELRRMVHVLVGHSTGVGSAVTIKREGDDVRLSVMLGPDSSTIAETERAWVSRMAIRYGGRYDLEGGAEVLSLPADGVSEKKERESLRKELDEARKQGEVYARELAAVIAQGEETTTPSTIPPAMHMTPAGERFASLAKFAGGVAAELRTILAPTAKHLVAPKSGEEDPMPIIARAVSRAQDFVAALGALGDLHEEEVSKIVDLTETARQASRALAGRAERADVKIEIAPSGSEKSDLPRVSARIGPRAALVLLRELLVQAIAASPRGSVVTVTIDAVGDLFPRVTVDDAGAPLPSSARRAFVALQVEPGTYGRPTSLPFYVANEIASWQGATLELGDAPAGGVRVAVTFPRAM
jgi:two-component system OmpR family sensor kinase